MIIFRKRFGGFNCINKYGDITNMNTEKDNLTYELIRSLQEGDGVPVESDSMLNNASRNLIKAMYNRYGSVWLGEFNPSKSNQMVMWKYDGGMIFNFCADFVVPKEDENLRNMLMNRLENVYTGTKEDSVRVEKIQNMICEIGGELLFWS